MWSWDEEDHGGHDGVDGQSDQAEPVNHHGRELPVRDDQVLLVLLPHSLGQISARE